MWFLMVLCILGLIFDKSQEIGINIFMADLVEDLNNEQEDN